MQIRPIQSRALRARKAREGTRENHRAVETRRGCRQERERDENRRGKRETRISNNRVSTIKANPSATLIMVCRIDLSRSPAQTARPNAILPVSAPSFEASIILRENWYPWKALYGGGGGGFTAVLRPRFRLSRQTRATSRPIIFDVVENSSGERKGEVYEGIVETSHAFSRRFSFTELGIKKGFDHRDGI